MAVSGDPTIGSRMPSGQRVCVAGQAAHPDSLFLIIFPLGSTYPLTSYVHHMEASTAPAFNVETVLSYIKTPYFVVFCILLLIFLVYRYKDSFMPKKADKPDELDKLIDSIRDKQSKIKGGGARSDNEDKTE